jgi:hypothetical protein
MSRLYRGYALTFESEFDLPGATEIEPLPETIVDVTITHGRVPAERCRDRRGFFARLDEGVLISPSGRAHYWCVDSRTILVDPEAGADPGAVSEGLCAFAIPALLWMRGDILLHAAAAVLPGADSAILIAGHSGAGKTTVLAHLAEAGARVVADDIVRLDPDLSVSGLSALLRVGPGGVDRIVAPGQRCTAAALSVVHMLAEPRTGQTPVFRSLSLDQRMRMLLAYQYRPRTPRMLGLATAMLPALARIAETVPMFEWHRCESRRALEAEEYAALQAGSALRPGRDCGNDAGGIHG